ncbi:disease resistance protein RPV1-like [Syzygium oleosum]|uniref:disease resistance protein RPV1-like n=1 Tax=Syzygium oleosum TaxID=219896 RepID=UPI0024B9C83B|nr:disease resistance protein RPV1-like [Syzygium oleosum]
MDRNVKALASFLLLLYFLSVMWLLPSRSFAGGFQIGHSWDILISPFLIRMLVSSFRGRRRSTGLLHKRMQSALMVLETLASLYVVSVVLSNLCVYLWEKYTGEIELDPDMEVEKLALALVVWVVVSALHIRIRRRNSGLAKLMQSAVIVFAYTFILWEVDMEIVALAYIIWLAISVLGLPLWIEVTGGTEHLREWGMGLFGHFALLDPSIFTYARVTAVWIILYAFYSECERLVWDGMDTAPKEVASSLSISALAKKEFRVFLSVNRGPDVRDEFIDFLMVHLTRSGISVFGLGKELPEGEELVEVIKRSNISIPIISKGYASSESCLIELGLLLECRRTNGQTIIPIFYDVDPSDVRYVTGSFELSLKMHQMKGTDGQTIRAWGRALREVGGLKRFYSADNNSWSNYKLLKQFLLDMLQMFSKWDVEENLVGIQDRVQEVMTKLGVNYRDGQSVGLRGGDVRVVGIYGTGGVGKTTLAKVIYKDIASLFDGCSYLEDVQERFAQYEGLKSLQNQLISDLLKRSCPKFTYEEGEHIIRHRFHSMRVLIILDDVNHHSELKPFIGKLSWFGPRSRIIVTTRDYGLINVPEVAERYEVEPLKPDQALFLFRRHASDVLPFPEGYDSLFDEIISVTRRIPLAIEVLACLLCRTPTTLWQHTLKIMSNHVDPVEGVLMASFDFLNYATREILLDIACFFVGEDIANPFSMWCACGYDPLSGIKVLLDMSLVQIGENNKLWMHDQLRNLCQQMVKTEDPERPERRSRLWKHEDAVSVLKERKGTERVQALNLKFDGRRNDGSPSEEFELLPGLRLLKLGKTRITGDCKNSPSNLRWLDWQGCPEIFGDCDLHLKELVILDLSWSKVAHDWKGWNQIKMPQLKILNLTGCTGLLMTPDLSGFEKLEILILEHCSRLVKIDASIAHLKCLVTLNLKFCGELCMLPKELNDMKEMKELLIDGTSIKEIPSTLAIMKKLKSLSASNCFSLNSLPESIGLLKDLSVLLLDSAKIVELPDSIGELVQLKQLSLRNCRCLGELPDSIGELGSTLIELDVSGTGISKLPGSIRNLRSLKLLKMDSCFIREFPRDIGRLTNLEEIRAWRCRSLEGDIPSDIAELKSLRILVLGYTRISSLPSGIQSLCCLQTLDLLHCDRIEVLPILPSSLTRLRVISRNMKVVPFIDHLTKMEELCLGDEDPEELELPSAQRMMNSILTREAVTSLLWPKRFPRLKVLELSHSRITDIRLRDECLPQITKLVVSGANLRRVPQLPSTLSFLSVRGCLSLKRLPTIQCLKSLTELRLSHSAIREVEGLGELEALEIIDISHCEIRSLDGLDQLTSLISLMLSDCDHLQKLPNISNLKRLKVLEIRRCREIKNIQGLQVIRSTLEKLHVG